MCTQQLSPLPIKAPYYVQFKLIPISLTSNSLSSSYRSPQKCPLQPAFVVIAETAGSIFTASETAPTMVDAFIVVGDKIAFVGTKDFVKQEWLSIRAWHNIEQDFDDLHNISIPAGQMVLPGFIGSYTYRIETNSHLHFLEGGESLLAPLSKAKTKQGSSFTAIISQRVLMLKAPEFLDIVGDYARSKPSEDVIRLNGFSDADWDASPTAQDFEDHLGPDGKPDMAGRKIIISSRDCHMQLVSRAVLEDPDVAENIGMGRKQAVLSSWMQTSLLQVCRTSSIISHPDVSAGVFKENAQRLIFDNGIQYTDVQLNERFDLATKECLKYGITTQTDAGLRPWSLDHYMRIVSTGGIRVRTYAMLYTKPSDKDFTIELDLKGTACSDLSGNRLCVRAVKIFADGAMRSSGAQLCEPYADDPKNSGFLLASEADLKRVIEMALEKNLQPCIHAIGDAAISTIVDILEKQNLSNLSSCRPRIEHAQILSDKDRKRLANLKLVSNPVTCTVIWTSVSGDWYIHVVVTPRWAYALFFQGDQRAKEDLYPFRSMLDHGVKFACGTDWPVENLNPMNTLLDAIRPRDDDHQKVLTPTEVLLGMTQHAAFACHNEHLIGSLEVGKLADFVILNKHIFSMEPADLLRDLQAGSVTVLETYIGGVKEYPK
ncbi:amidohydrolase family-domain-containing protein [Mucidula mucida]|nr:amidohydrolase family-domain-containing protein [Mucidula mucida]